MALPAAAKEQLKSAMEDARLRDIAGRRLLRAAGVSAEFVNKGGKVDLVALLVNTDDPRLMVFLFDIGEEIARIQVWCDLQGKWRQCVAPVAMNGAVELSFGDDDLGFDKQLFSPEVGLERLYFEMTRAGARVAHSWNVVHGETEDWRKTLSTDSVTFGQWFHEFVNVNFPKVL